MDIGSLGQTPIAPAPAPSEQPSKAKQIDTKEPSNEGSKIATPQPQQSFESKPSDPDGAGGFHVVA